MSQLLYRHGHLLARLGKITKHIYATTNRNVFLFSGEDFSSFLSSKNAKTYYKNTLA